MVILIVVLLIFVMNMSLVIGDSLAARMDKHQVAQVLNEIAQLLELKGENPFKVRAYENAARIVEGLSDDLSDLIKSGRLTEIRGIGKNIADTFPPGNFVE